MSGPAKLTAAQQADLRFKEYRRKKAEEEALAAGASSSATVEPSSSTATPDEAESSKAPSSSKDKPLVVNPFLAAFAHNQHGNKSAGVTRSTSSWNALCKYFDYHDGLKFRDVVGTATHHLIVLFQKGLQDVIPNASEDIETVTWAKVWGRLKAERTSGGSGVTHGYPNPTVSNAWSELEWVIWLVHQMRVVLFDLSTSPFADLGLDDKHRVDRAFSIYMRLRANDLIGTRAPGSNKREKQTGKRTSKQQLSEEVIENSDVDDTPGSAENTSGTPEQEEEADGTPQPSEKARGKRPARTAGAEPLPSVPAPKLKYKKGSASKTAPKQTAVKAPKLSSLKASAGLPRTPNAERLRTMTFKCGPLQTGPTSAAALGDLEGDDVDENPMKHWFYKLDGSDSARLIGADHLWGVDPNQVVDWLDDNKVDPQNASPDKVKEYYDSVGKAVPRWLDPAAHLAGAGAADTRSAEAQILANLAAEPTPELQSRRDAHAATYDVLAMLTGGSSRTDVFGKARPLNTQTTVQDETETEAVGETDKEADAPDTSGGLGSLGIHDSAFRARQKQVQDMMDIKDVSADEYEKSLSRLNIRHRSHPMMPGSKSRPLLWCQVTAAAKFVDNATTRRRTGKGVNGDIYADSTGLGKTDGGIATILQYLDDFDLELQEARDEKDWAKLTELGQSKVVIWQTDLALIKQTAQDIVRATDTVRVYVYHGSNDAETPLPETVRRISQPLTLSNSILDPNRRANHRTVILTTYATLSQRHGRPGHAAWMMANHNMTLEEAHAYYDEFGVHPDFNGNLDGRVSIYVSDEAARLRNELSQVSRVTFQVDAVYNLLITATPVPWRSSGFLGLLKLVQNPDLDAEAQTVLPQTDQNPYALNSPVARFRPTVTAFKMYMKDGISAATEGQILRGAFESTVLARSYRTSCVTHPDGDVNKLANKLPPYVAVRLHIQNDEDAQGLYDRIAPEIMKDLYVPSKQPGRQKVMNVNGNAARLLNLACLYPPFAYAPNIAKVKHNSFLQRLQLLHDDGHYCQFLHLLLCDVKTGCDALDIEGVIPGDEVPLKTDGAALVHAFVSRSARLVTILKLLNEWCVKDGEKVVVFCQNPLEQMFLSAILHVVNLRSSALLARLDSDAKQALLDKFNTDPHRWYENMSASEFKDLSDLICISKHQNAGINLQNYAHRMLITGPSGSDSVFVQMIGRIVRVGQKRECIIVELYDPNTYNVLVTQTAVDNALPMLAANMNLAEAMHFANAEEDMLDDDGNMEVPRSAVDGWVSVNGILMNKAQAEFPPEHVNMPDMTPDEFLTALYNMRRTQEIKVLADGALEPTMAPINTPKKRKAQHQGISLQASQETPLRNLASMQTTRFQDIKKKLAGGVTHAPPASWEPTEGEPVYVPAAIIEGQKMRLMQVANAHSELLHGSRVALGADLPIRKFVTPLDEITANPNYQRTHVPVPGSAPRATRGPTPLPATEADESPAPRSSPTPQASSGGQAQDIEQDEADDVNGGLVGYNNEDRVEMFSEDEEDNEEMVDVEETGDSDGEEEEEFEGFGDVDHDVDMEGAQESVEQDDGDSEDDDGDSEDDAGPAHPVKRRKLLLGYVKDFEEKPAPVPGPSASSPAQPPPGAGKNWLRNQKTKAKKRAKAERNAAA